MTTKRRVYFTMVRHPVKGWVRVGPAYPARDAAKVWLPFVRGYWKGCPVRVSQFTLRLVDGQLDERSVRTLDRKFNMDAPKVREEVRESSRIVVGVDLGKAAGDWSCATEVRKDDDGTATVLRTAWWRPGEHPPGWAMDAVERAGAAESERRGEEVQGR